MSDLKHIPSISVTYAQKGTSAAANELGMRPMQERAYQKRGEQYLLIKSAPASTAGRPPPSASGEVQKSLRKALLKYKLRKDNTLFERAYAYIKEYY